MVVSTANTFRGRKRMAGVECTDEIFSLYESCLSITQENKENDDNNGNNNAVDNNDNQTTKKSSAAAPSEIVKSATAELSFEKAKSILLQFSSSSNNTTNKTNSSQNPGVLPILVIRAMQVILLQSYTDTDTNTKSSSSSLDTALSKSKLCFTKTDDAPKTEEEKKQREQYEKRMERLRLRQEETNYYKLTSNIHNKAGNDDQITAKSMTYAASIGLNMIIAPLSFGVFMYFFAGGLIKFLGLGGEEINARQYGASKMDISRVIIGVISGVAMLFIEMLLFVIRTHEFDKELSKKNKKQRKHYNHVKPFGDYSSASEKNYDTTTAKKKKKKNDKKQN